YKWVSERGSRSAAADVAFQRELVEFIRRKICSPCHAGSSESRTVNRSALMEIMEVLAFILRAIEPIGASVWPARPACLSRTCRANRAHDFARVFRVRLLCRVVDTEALPDRCGRCRALDCSQGSAAAILLARFVWRHLYGLCNKMPNTSQHQRRLTATLVLKPTCRRSPQLGEYSISCIAAFLDLAHTATTPPPPSPPPGQLVNDSTETEAAAQAGGAADSLQAG